MRVHRKTLFLIILLILVITAITGFVSQYAAGPIVYEIQRETDNNARPSGGTARKLTRQPVSTTEPMEEAQR
jgi:hypothetical protein